MCFSLRHNTMNYRHHTTLTHTRASLRSHATIFGGASSSSSLSCVILAEERYDSGGGPSSSSESTGCLSGGGACFMSSNALRGFFISSVANLRASASSRAEDGVLHLQSRFVLEIRGHVSLPTEPPPPPYVAAAFPQLLTQFFGVVAESAMLCVDVVTVNIQERLQHSSLHCDSRTKCHMIRLGRGRSAFRQPHDEQRTKGVFVSRKYCRMHGVIDDELISFELLHVFDAMLQSPLPLCLIHDV